MTLPEICQSLTAHMLLACGSQNATVLQVGIYQVLYLNRNPEDAYAPLAPKGPYMPFRDASCGIPTFNLQPINCIRVRENRDSPTAATAAG